MDKIHYKCFTDANNYVDYNQLSYVSLTIAGAEKDSKIDSSTRVVSSYNRMLVSNDNYIAYVRSIG